jgi:signal transduction histidine kinase/CheY-like chemotaxis protein
MSRRLPTLSPARNDGLLGLLVGQSAASRMGRRLLAASLLVPLVLGALRLWGQRAGLYGTGVGTALFAASNALIFAWLFTRSALQVHRHDQRRQQAEAHLRETNADLELWVAERTRALADVNGALRRQMLELKRAQEGMVGARDTAEKAMRARADFLARMSHEIRTPMNGIIGMTELALQTALSPEQREYLDSVRSSARSLLSLINDILDFSKIDAGKLRLHQVPFHLRDSIGAGLRALGGQAAAKGLELILDIAPDVPAGLIGDPERLQQVITNLVGNAVKFTDRGEVAVKVALVQATSARVTIQVDVVDTGIGIPAERLGAVFESFVQADEATTRRFGGTGLGLAICAQLVELMQGQIRVDSQLGLGSRFTFTASFERDPGAAQGPSATPALAGLPVLLVDDHPRQREVIGSLLASWNMRVVACAAEGALEAAQAARQAGAPFRLLLLDTGLPGTNVLVLGGRLRAACAEGAGVILLSGAGNSPEAGREAVMGPHAQVAKPVMASYLLETIQALIAGPAGGPAALEGHSVHPDDGPSLRVLVAEDNAVNRRVITRILERAGHRPVAVENGRLALAALAQQPAHDRFDLVLMDVQMPEMDGLQAARTLRAAEAALGWRVPIIALTAQAMKGDRERCIAAGMDAYVSKPIDRDQLFGTIEEVMSNHIRPDAPAAGAASAAPPAASDGQADASAAGPRAFDRDELMERIDGDRELLSELVQVFREGLGPLIGELESAVAAGDPTRVQRAGHTLKGALLNLAAHPAAELAREIDDSARRGDLGGAPANLARLLVELDRLETALARAAVEAAA